MKQNTVNGQVQTFYHGASHLFHGVRITAGLDPKKYPKTAATVAAS